MALLDQGWEIGAACVEVDFEFEYERTEVEVSRADKVCGKSIARVRRLLDLSHSSSGFKVAEYE
jgi:hypothetical protein